MRWEREKKTKCTIQGVEIVMSKGFVKEGREPEERISMEKGWRNGG